MLDLMDWFCGAGGSSQGVDSIPGVRVTRAANHWDKAIESHAANFPQTDHYLGDIRLAPVDKWPVADLFWADMRRVPPGRENRPVDGVTLAEWAETNGLSLNTIRNHWMPRDDFPEPLGVRRNLAGAGRPAGEYDRNSLDAFLRRWEEQRQPDHFVLPAGPDDFRTLGAIARLLGVDGRTVSQYRSALDGECQFKDRGRRRLYRTADVVQYMNARGGHGVQRSSSP